jgi:GNAT superfamily N-acetyltransferase
MEKLSSQSDYDIRYSNQGDLPYLEKWLKDPEMQRWYPISTEQDLTMMAKNWIGFSKYGASLTATYQNEPVGIATLFLMPYRKVIHHCLLYFIVSPEKSRRGVGTSILRNITHLGKSYFHFEKMHIEVYEGCPAIPLLIKEGYREVYRQERFIKESEGHYLARIVYEIEFILEKEQRSLNGK